MREETLPLSHFEAIYERGPDPWGFATSAYEADKYAATMAALPRERYGAAFEVGCSVGVLTRLLAARCDGVLAVEPVASALAAACERNRDLAHVRFDSMFVPAGWPDEQFDLVVLSEVLDYLGGGDLKSLAERLRTTVLPGGTVLLVHWLGKKRGRGPQPSEASQVLIEHCAEFMPPENQSRNDDYRIDVLVRAP